MSPSSALRPANAPIPVDSGRRPVGWALVGCGWVARDFAVPALRRAAGSRLVVACDRDPRALRALPHGVPTTTDLAEALAMPGVDAVYVATPNDAHAPVVRDAAAAGKHVLCEKPMATCLTAARAMVEACRAQGVRYATAFDQRFHAAHRTLRRLVAEGALGTVTQARVHYACWLPAAWSPTGPADARHDNWRIDPARAGGGALVDLAPHGLDLLETLLGDRWETLEVMTQRHVHGYPVDDGAVLMGRMHSGLLASLHVAYNCPDAYPRRVLELIGTRARALAVDTMGQTAGGTLELTEAATGAARPVAVDDDRSPFELQVEAYCRALHEDGSEVPAWPWTADDDLRRFALLEHARENEAARPAIAPAPDGAGWH